LSVSESRFESNIGNEINPNSTSASTFWLIVAYVDWISQADSTTEIFVTAITLAEVIMKQQLNLPPDRAIESSLASTIESPMFATSASLTKLVSSTQSISLASSKLSRLLYTASAVLASSATSATNGLVEHDSKINLNGPASKLIVICNWTKISLIFREGCTIFCEGEWLPSTTKMYGDFTYLFNVLLFKLSKLIVKYPIGLIVRFIGLVGHNGLIGSIVHMASSTTITLSIKMASSTAMTLSITTASSTLVSASLAASSALLALASALASSASVGLSATSD
jgi:hypothetical protein